MGTRHNIGVKIDGQLKVRQYGQWDGYPLGQGKGIADFLHGEMDKRKFEAALRECRFMTKDEVAAFNAEHSGKSWQQAYPWLSRDAGSNVLSLIQGGAARVLVQSSDDEDPETWCEYFYLIDMDAETVTMRSKHAKHGDVTLPFAEWTVEAMERLEKSESDDDATEAA